MSTLAIMADDLTGSMDTGVLFANKYLTVSVIFDKSSVEELSKVNEALIIDTESRNISPDKAYNIVGGYARVIGQSDIRLIYKKIDSTLRGNIGKELEAILDDGAFDMAALVPALPLNGRTTSAGHHYLNGKPLTESDLASDPFSPVESSYIPEIVSKQASLKTKTVFLKEVRQGGTHLVEVLHEIYRAGCSVAVVDAETESDLDTIAEALEKSSFRILPCGSAGLFSRMYTGKPQNPQHTQNTNTGANGPVAVISGSPARMSKLQIETAKRHGVFVIRVAGTQIVAEPEAALSEIERVANLAVETLRQGKNIIIDGAGEGKKELNEAYKGKNELLAETSRKIQDAIACITEVIAEKVKLSGLVIFGGDTALSICRKLGVKALRILGEVEPLVPYGMFTGGKLDGVRVATKAGGFGSEDIILKVQKFFAE